MQLVYSCTIDTRQTVSLQVCNLAASNFTIAFTLITTNIFLGLKSSHKMIDVPKKSKKFILASHFDGLPKHENFKLVEVDIPELQTGGTNI